MLEFVLFTSLFTNHTGDSLFLIFCCSFSRCCFSSWSIRVMRFFNSLPRSPKKESTLLYTFEVSVVPRRETANDFLIGFRLNVGKSVQKPRRTKDFLNSKFLWTLNAYDFLGISGYFFRLWDSLKLLKYELFWTFLCK